MTLLAVASLCLALLPSAAQSEDAFRAAFDRGLAALAAQQLDPAQAAFEEARSLRPQNALVYSHLAQIHAHKREFQQAITRYRQAIALQPREPQFYFRLAVLQAQLQRFHDAEQAVQDLLRVRPGYAEAYLLLGRIAQEQEDHETAERYLRRYRRRRPGDPEGLWRLAVTLVAREKYHEAEPLLKLALRKDPRLGPAQFNLGLLYSRTGQESAAAAHLESATHLMPENAQAFYQLGITRLRLGDPAGSESALRKALELAPDHIQALYALGTLLRQAGHEDEATQKLAEYERLSSAALQDRERTKRLGSFHLEVKALLEQERVAEAEARLIEILALDPKNDLAYYRQGQIAFLRHDYAKALELAGQATALKGFEPAYHQLQGMSLERLGRDQEAAAAYRHVLELADYSEAHVALAGIATRKGDVHEAVTHLERAVALEPKDPDVRLALADALARAGDQTGSRRQRALAESLRGSAPPR